MRKRVLAGLLITLLIFVVARKISKNRPSLSEWTFDEVRITHTTVYEQVGPGQPEILLNVAPPVEIDAVVTYRAPGETELVSVALEEVSDGVWTARLPAGEKGDKIEYGFRISIIEELEGGASHTSTTESGYHLIKYKGEVSVTVLILHILCMFAAFFFIVEAMIGAIIMVVKGEDREFTVAQTRWVLLFTFLGGWPLGFALNWQRFGVMWEGFPFGYDITDNKTQLIAIFWLIVAAMSWKSFTCRRTGRDMAGDRLFAGTVMTASLLSLILYLVPHSL
jgi:hypothetical protein